MQILKVYFSSYKSDNRPESATGGAGKGGHNAHEHGAKVVEHDAEVALLIQQICHNFQAPPPPPPAPLDTGQGPAPPAPSCSPYFIQYIWICNNKPDSGGAVNCGSGPLGSKEGCSASHSILDRIRVAHSPLY